MASYVGAMWRCRYFWMSLVKIDLRTRYRRSVLGPLCSRNHFSTRHDLFLIPLDEVLFVDVEDGWRQLRL